MSLYAIKPAFTRLLRPLTARLAAAGATANQVTLFAAAVSVLLGVAVAVAAAAEVRWPFALLAPWFLVRMACNAVDGQLAREYGQRSRLGAYLNELSDVVADTALYAPFAWLPGVGGLPVALLAGLAALSELAGALGPAVGASRRYDGPLGKSDRALVAGALGLWVGAGLPLRGPAAAALGVVLGLLLAITVVNRVRLGVGEAG